MWQFTISISRRGILGALVLGVIIAFSSLSIVKAERDRITHDNQVYKCSSGQACVEGDATGKNVFGVLGKSAAGTGVQGNSTATNKNSGVAGVNSATSGAGYGVYGRSSNGPGIYGTSATHNGIEGHASTPSTSGVAGYWEPCGSCYARNAAGVYGFASGYSSAEYGYGEGTYGVSAETDAGNDRGAAILAKTDSGADIFQGLGNGGSSLCIIDHSANLTCSGTIQGGADVTIRHRTNEGRSVVAYASQEATETIEDVGTARISGGLANVRIDPAFVSVMDHKWYYVFLTPMGDTRGLYVSMKTASGFQVRENERGRSNVQFDYRIVAHPVDAKYDRLPDAPAMPRPRLPLMPRP